MKMKSITNKSGSKIVKISSDNFCMFIQIYNGTEQVLETKSFKRESSAVRWAQSMLV